MHDIREVYKKVLIKRLLQDEITHSEAYTLAAFLYEDYQKEEDEDVRNQIYSLLAKLACVIPIAQ